MSKHYQLLDSGNGMKLEQFGKYSIVRPCSQAVWSPQLPEKAWNEADARFTREPSSRWEGRCNLPDEWEVVVDGLTMKVTPTDFGHLGVFPEHHLSWKWVHDRISSAESKMEVLNLFAYSGGATLAAARAGASVCHLDASKGMVAWAKKNAERNKLGEAPIRWIVDDAIKFIRREVRRGRKYDGIILDPPSFGRGAQGQLFKIEDDLLPMLLEIRELMSENSFIWLSCHTPGFTPLVLENMLSQLMGRGKLGKGELVLPCKSPTLPVPSGTYAWWSHG